VLCSIPNSLTRVKAPSSYSGKYSKHELEGQIKISALFGSLGVKKDQIPNSLVERRTLKAYFPFPKGEFEGIGWELTEQGFQQKLILSPFLCSFKDSVSFMQIQFLCTLFTSYYPKNHKNSFRTVSFQGSRSDPQYRSAVIRVCTIVFFFILSQITCDSTKKCTRWKPGQTVLFLNHLIDHNSQTYPAKSQ
jgi:hypothetical protein